MKSTFRLLFASTLFVVGAGLLASTALGAGKLPPADIPPPPGLNDPGVSTPQTTPPNEAPAVPPAADANNDPLAPLSKPDARLVRDKASRDAAATSQRIAASDVTTRKQGTDTVQEYRQHGHVWMIRIVPQYGPPQTFMTSVASGRLIRDPHEGPVSPVYYTLYEWQ
jgi:hypothetical protein